MSRKTGWSNRRFKMGTAREGERVLADMNDVPLSPRIVRLGNLLKRRAAARYKYLLNLGPAQFGIIQVLGAKSQSSLGALAEEMGLDNGQVSRVVTELVEKGLIDRQRDKGFYKQ